MPAHKSPRIRRALLPGRSSVGRLAHALPPQRRAQRREATRNTTSTERSERRAGRAAVSTSVHPGLQRPGAPGMAGDRRADLAGATPSATTYRPVSSPSRLVHAQREQNKGCDPRSRERAAVFTSAGTAGLAVLCMGDGRPSGARRRPKPVARRAAHSPAPRAAGTRAQTSQRSPEPRHSWAYREIQPPHIHSPSS